MMISSSNDDKSDICQFFYQDLFHIVNTVINKISCKMDKIFLRYSMFFHRGFTSSPPPPQPWDFQKNPVQVGLTKVERTSNGIWKIIEISGSWNIQSLRCYMLSSTAKLVGESIYLQSPQKDSLKYYVLKSQTLFFII